MEAFLGLEGFHREWKESVVCIGTFDGVHIGHREVISRAVDRAEKLGIPAVLATFDRNPAAILAPDRCPPAISSLKSNLREFEKTGIAVTTVLRFDHSFSEIHAEEFFEEWLKQKLGAVSVVVGHDFTFGKDRKGTPEWLVPRIETDIVPPFNLDGERVSSSRIRRALEGGDMILARRLLGRPFEIPGVVVTGEKLGRQLGFPTLNIARSFAQITPADGVYAGVCETPLGLYKAAASIGVRPSINEHRTIEAHLLDYAGHDLYGAPVTLSLLEKLRDQAMFSNLEDLRNQIATDVERVSHVN